MESNFPELQSGTHFPCYFAIWCKDTTKGAHLPNGKYAPISFVIAERRTFALSRSINITPRDIDRPADQNDKRTPAK